MVNIMSSNNQTSPSGGFNLAALSKGNWTDFKRRLSELTPLIARISDEFEYIREKQRQHVRGLSKELEQLPRDGDIKNRLDMQAHLRLVQKKATGQTISDEDRQRWKKDTVVTEPTNVELWILTDGSVSMGYDIRKGKGKRIDAALQIAAILREAGKRAEFDVFAGMWGSSEIKVLASPGDSDQKVGEAFEKVRKGLNSGTNLAPSLKEVILTSAKQKGAHPFAGMTHFLIISDGGVSDSEETLNILTTLFRRGPAVSVDIAVMSDNQKTEMHKLVEAVKQNVPSAAIGVIGSTDPDQLPQLLANAIKRRFARAADGVQGRPDAEKRERFKAVGKMLGLYNKR